MADNENNLNGETPSPAEKPDISFGSDSKRLSPAEEPPKPAPQSKPQPAKQARTAPAVKKPSDGAEGTRPVKKEPEARQAQTQGQPRNNKPPQSKGGAPKRSANGSNGAPSGKRPANGKPKPRTAQPRDDSGKRPSRSGKPPVKKQTKPQSKPAKRSEPKQKPSSAPSAEQQTPAFQPKKKVKFTRRQAMQVAGLILVLFLIFGLAVFLIFNHYFNLIGGPAEDVSNSSPKLYSDVDYSKPDTFEKSTEDEKLKELTNKAEKITSSDVMNILLVGEDLRDTAEQDAGNTDVMMLISVNTKDNTITLTSIMRDCYVWFGSDETGWYSDRINAAYWYGGMKLTKSTIEDYLNVKIDRYVLVNFKVFIDIVDALGGIDMHVTDLEANGDPNEDPNGDNTRGMQNPLDEQNKYLGNKKKTDYIKKGGDLHLNGNQALAYARLRHVGNADYERTERQRRVIKEMIKESRHMSLVEMDQLANKVFPQVKTDVTKGELAGLLLEMLNYRNYKLQEFRVPADDTFTNEFIDGKDVLQVDFTANQELFKEIAYGTAEVKKKSSTKME